MWSKNKGGTSSIGENTRRERKHEDDELSMPVHQENPEKT